MSHTRVTNISRLSKSSVWNIYYVVWHSFITNFISHQLDIFSSFVLDYIYMIFFIFLFIYLFIIYLRNK